MRHKLAQIHFLVWLPLMSLTSPSFASRYSNICELMRQDRGGPNTRVYKRALDYTCGSRCSRTKKLEDYNEQTGLQRSIWAIIWSAGVVIDSLARIGKQIDVTCRAKKVEISQSWLTVYISSSSRLRPTLQRPRFTLYQCLQLPRSTSTF